MGRRWQSMDQKAAEIQTQDSTKDKNHPISVSTETILSVRVFIQVVPSQGLQAALRRITR